MKKQLTDEKAQELWATDLGLVDAALSVPCANQTLRATWKRLYGGDAYEARRARIKGAAVAGENHPIRKNNLGGKNHWNYNPDARTVSSQGYYRVHAPDWWTGKIHEGRVQEHNLVYAQTHGLTEIPAGHVVHHKDGNKLNNEPENLELMTRAEHARHHKLQGKSA